MILYSSELKSKPRWSVISEYRMPMESLAEISSQLVELVVVGVIHGRAVRFAHSIDHDDQAFLPARGVIRAGRMGEVVVHLMNAIGGEIRERPVESLEQCLAGEDLPVLLGRDGVHQVHGAVRRVVEAVRDLIDVARLDAGCRQAVLDRPVREIAPCASCG